MVEHSPLLLSGSLKNVYTLSEAWSGVNWADLMAAQGAFGADFYDRSTRTIVGTMLWTEYRPVIKIGPKVALGRNEIRPIHSAPSLGQSIGRTEEQKGVRERQCGMPRPINFYLPSFMSPTQ